MAATPFDFYRGKRVLVVGAAQGHGRAIAEGFAKAGAELLLIDRNPAQESFMEEMKRCGTVVRWAVADVSKPSELIPAIDSLGMEAGIDGLVYVPRGRVKQDWSKITEQEWDEDLDVGLKGAFFSVQAASRHFRSGEDSSFVLFLSSVLSRFSGGESAGYHAAKGGLESLTRFLAQQLGPAGARVNAVQMGWIVKEDDWDRYTSEGNRAYRANADSVHPLGRVGRSTDLVDTILHLCSDRASFITGQVICLDGGATLQDQAGLAIRYNLPKIPPNEQ